MRWSDQKNWLLDSRMFKNVQIATDSSPARTATPTTTCSPSSLTVYSVSSNPIVAAAKVNENSYVKEVFDRCRTELSMPEGIYQVFT